VVDGDTAAGAATTVVGDTAAGAATTVEFMAAVYR
jgi:hypothetical protein